MKCELSSYGDFLQPLGKNASPSYIVEKETNEELALQRSALYRNLYGTNLSVLVLKNSFFHHLGSMKEYLDSFCFKNMFSHVFPVHSTSFTSWSVNCLTPLYIDGTVMHSNIHPLSCISEGSIVEYCDISVVMNVGRNCIISNIQFPGFSVQKLPFDIPDDTLLHTVAIQGGYVTIACGTCDDIKKRYDDRYAFEVNFFGKKLTNNLASDLECFARNCDTCSLWNAKIFPMKDTPEESLVETLKIVQSRSDAEMEYIYYNLDEACVKLISMGDVLVLKDTDRMIEYQQKLFYKIKLKKETHK